MERLPLLARMDAALALRLAMVLACVKHLDLSELGYSGYLAFCRENVDWSLSWVRALIRLVESPLETVKAAAAAGHLPLRVAVLAPGRIPVEEQEEWLAGAVLAQSGSVRTDITFHDDDAAVIERARELARVCMGRVAPLVQVDAFILRHWREGIAGRAIAEGRIPPPPPEGQPPDFHWATPSGQEDSGRSQLAPAEGLLGPWRAPSNLEEALAQLEAVQALRRSRLSELARGFVQVATEESWREAGFESLWGYAESELGWSRRTAQRYARLGRALARYPSLDQAVRQGLPPDAARAIDELARSQTDCDRWLDIARHVGRQELRRALANPARLEEYEQALGIARRHAASILGPDGPTTQPSGTTSVVELGARCSETPRAATPDDPPAPDDPQVEGAQPTTPAGSSAPRARLRVALSFAEPVPAARVRAHPRLAEASRWFLANNPLPRHTGFATSKTQARHRCQNPECGKVTLRVEAHHIHWRRYGGADTLSNAVVLCPACHLRGVHTSDERIRITRLIVEGHETLLWEFLGRAPVLQFRRAEEEENGSG